MTQHNRFVGRRFFLFQKSNSEAVKDSSTVKKDINQSLQGQNTHLFGEGG